MTERVPEGSYPGVLEIGGLQIPCAVLDDGRRVITQRGFFETIGKSKAKGGQSGGADRLPPFIASKNLQPYVEKHITVPTEPILFRPKSGVRAYGYLAELIPEVCEVFLAAQDDNALQAQQEHIAKQCAVLVRGFARVGITALIDEATGYQYIRQRNALNKILEAYIRKELMPWTKCFPDEFYEQMFRVWGWEYNADFGSRRPGFAGVLTRRLIYEPLAPGVLEELERVNPTDGHGRRKHKLHQFLTDDIGHPHLQRQITEVTLLLRISDSLVDFFAKFAKAYPRNGTQIYLDLASIEMEAAAVTEDTNPDPKEPQTSGEDKEKKTKSRKKK